MKKVFATQHLFSFIPQKIESLRARSVYKQQNYGIKYGIDKIFDVASMKYGVCILWYGNQKVCPCFRFWDSLGKICFNCKVCNILVSGFSRRRRPEFASTSQNAARATKLQHGREWICIVCILSKICNLSNILEWFSVKIVIFPPKDRGKGGWGKGWWLI